MTQPGSVFPERIREYRCPSCGKRVEGAYNIDASRKRCSKLWHKAMVIRREYVLVDADRPDSEVAVRVA
jgi:hypothetical protein